MTKKTFDPELKNLMIIDKIEEMMDDAQTVINCPPDTGESYTCRCCLEMSRRAP